MKGGKIYMKNNNINWWLVIGVTIIVAVIASLITVSITGNTVKVLRGYSKTSPIVYTAAEVDIKIKEAIMRNQAKSCIYVSRKSLSPTGQSFEGKNSKEICNTRGLVPIIFVEGKDTALYNSKNCSSSYQIFSDFSNVLYSIYGNDLPEIEFKLGSTIEDYCGNALFPDGSFNDNFSNSKFRVWTGVLCCSKSD